jgi:hypothetical protein
MSRRRFRAMPAPARSGGFNIGVTMTPTVTVPATSATNVGGATPSGPVILVATIAPSDIGAPAEANGCSWIAFMRGVGDAATIEWSLVWDTSSEYGEQIVYSGAFDNAVIGILTGTFDIYWIDVTATVNGTAYTTRIGSERGSGDNAACSF